MQPRRATIRPSRRTCYKISSTRAVRQLSLLAAVCLPIACAACSSWPPQGVLIPAAEAAQGSSRVEVLASTT